MPKIKINQGRIIDRCIEYVEKQAKRYPDKYKKEDIASFKNISGGQCSGLSALWLYRKSMGQEQSQYFEILEKISQWDNKAKYSKDQEKAYENMFEQFINDMRWAHAWENPIDNPQGDLEKIFATFLPEGAKSLEQEFNMGFVFTEKELIQTLGLVIHEDKMFHLSGINHAISLMKKNGKYCVYDPNNEEGEKICDTIEEATKAIRKFLFTDIGFYSKYMPVKIRVFRREGQDPSIYPSVERLANSYLKNIGLKQRVGIGNILSPFTLTHPLEFAVRRNDVESLKSILKSSQMKERITKLKKQGKSLCNETFIKDALSIGARWGYLDCVKELLNTDPNLDINFINNKGYTLLQIASRCGQLEVVKELLNRKPDLNMTDKFDRTALALAAEYGHVEVVIELLKDEKYSIIQKTQALIEAIKAGQIEVVKTFLNLYPNLGHGIGERVPLMTAIENEESEIAKILLKRFTLDNIFIYKSNRVRFLHLATKMGNIEIVKELFEKFGGGMEALLKEPDEHHNTPLKIAVENNDVKMIQLLLKHTPKPQLMIDWVDKPGRWSLNGLLLAASKRGQLAVVNLLLKNGANVNCKNEEGLTPFQIATDRNVKELLKRAAKVNVNIAASHETNQKGSGKKEAERKKVYEFLVSSLSAFKSYENSLSQAIQNQKLYKKLFSSKTNKGLLVREVIKNLEDVLNNLDNYDPDQALAKVMEENQKFIEKNKKMRRGKVFSSKNPSELGQVLEGVKETHKRIFEIGKMRQDQQFKSIDILLEEKRKQWVVGKQPSAVKPVDWKIIIDFLKQNTDETLDKASGGPSLYHMAIETALRTNDERALSQLLDLGSYKLSTGNNLNILQEGRDTELSLGRVREIIRNECLDKLISEPSLTVFSNIDFSELNEKEWKKLYDAASKHQKVFILDEQENGFSLMQLLAKEIYNLKDKNELPLDLVDKYLDQGLKGPVKGFDDILKFAREYRRERKLQKETPVYLQPLDTDVPKPSEKQRRARPSMPPIVRDFLSKIHPKQDHPERPKPGKLDLNKYK